MESSSEIHQEHWIFWEFVQLQIKENIEANGDPCPEFGAFLYNHVMGSKHFSCYVSMNVRIIELDYIDSDTEDEGSSTCSPNHSPP
jgi:hypothetical protein